MRFSKSNKPKWDVSPIRLRLRFSPFDSSFIRTPLPALAIIFRHFSISDRAAESISNRFMKPNTRCIANLLDLSNLPTRSPHSLRHLTSIKTKS